MRPGEDWPEDDGPGETWFRGGRSADRASRGGTGTLTRTERETAPRRGRPAASPRQRTAPERTPAERTPAERAAPVQAGGGRAASGRTAAGRTVPGQYAPGRGGPSAQPAEPEPGPRRRAPAQGFARPGDVPGSRASRRGQALRRGLRRVDAGDDAPPPAGTPGSEAGPGIKGRPGGRPAAKDGPGPARVTAGSRTARAPAAFSPEAPAAAPGTTPPGAAAPGRAARTAHRVPFFLLLCGLLGGALISALVISTTLAEGSFRITQLQQSNTTLARQRQQLEEQVATARSAQVIEQRAYQLGMRTPGELRFLDLKTGRVETDAGTGATANISTPGYTP